MAAPRLEINLDKIYHNASMLVARLAKLGISVTGVTKAIPGYAEIANVMRQAGVTSLGDSRIENIKNMRHVGNDILPKDIPMTLIRSPMPSQVRQVVMYAEMSCNTEIEVIRKLSIEAGKQGHIHQILLMVELGDLREGILPEDLLDVVERVIELPNVLLSGIGANLACRSGVIPDANNMAFLSNLANRIEKKFSLGLDIVSGGNSANLPWVLSSNAREIGRINNLRLGEAILLGRETLQRNPLEGLSTDAFTLVAEVIEVKTKPSRPSGKTAQSAFGKPPAYIERGMIRQCILAVGVQDIDPDGLEGQEGIRVLGASSDHLIIESLYNNLAVGDEVRFNIDYGALVRGMLSPFVAKNFYTSKGCSISVFP